MIFNPYNLPPVINRNVPLFPSRHACGNLVYADIQSDYPVFYTRYAASPNGEYLRYGHSPIHACPACDYPLDLDWMRPLYLVQPMPFEMATRTETRKVCSNCWGQLHMGNRDVPVYDDDGNLIEGSHRLVLCHDCMYETIGYVTQRYVGFARERDYLDYGNCLIGLAEALELTEADGLPIRVGRNQPKLTVAENMAMMGF